jgi:signal transduction histidine kinase
VRERLVVAFVGLTVLVVALYGVPRAYLLADLVRSAEQSRVDRTADVLVLLVDERLSDGEPVTSAYLDSVATPGEGLTVSGLPTGEVRTSGDLGDPDGQVRATRALSGGGEVSVTRSGAAVGDEIAGALLPLVVLGLLLALLAGLGAWVLARRLARPFRELADVARGLGEGRLHPELPRYDVPEARAIGRALVEAGARLDHLLAQERHVAVHASHELRTPVTALRLELEDLALRPDTAGPVAAELQRSVTELDRLSRAITDLLELADSHRAASEIDLDLDALIADAVAHRRAEGVPLVHEPATPVPTRLDPMPVLQTLDLLVGEALAAGAEQVRVSVAVRAGHVEVRVAGAPDVGAEDGARWLRAKEQGVVAGGRVTRDGATLVLRLPRRTPLGSHHSAQ